MLEILWHNPDAKGYTDHINSEWLVHDGFHHGVTHDVSGPRLGRPYEAKCDIAVEASSLIRASWK